MRNDSGRSRLEGTSYSRLRVVSVRHIRWILTCDSREQASCSGAWIYRRDGISDVLEECAFAKSAKAQILEGEAMRDNVCDQRVVHVVRCSCMITEQYSGYHQWKKWVCGGENVPFAKADVEGNLELQLQRRKLGEQRCQDFGP
jgi:hypothetical protein